MSQPSDGEDLGPPPQAAEFVVGVLDAADRMDAASVRRLLAEASDVLGLGGCLDRVVMPVMRQIGLWWVGGSYTIPQEAMTTEAVRAWLDQCASFLPPPTHSASILLACGPHDRHTIGLEALAVLLRSRGWPCRLLGSRTTTPKLAIAVEATAPAAVVLVSHMETGHRRAVVSLEAVDRLGTAVFYAGEAFATPELRAGLPGRYLGRSLQLACSIITEGLADAA